MRRRLALALSALLLLPALPSAHAATPTAGQSTYVPVDPVRVLDTRNPGQSKVPAGGTIDLTVAGVSGVPADATAVVLNVTATGSATATDIRVYPTPSDGSYPDVSNLNVAPRGTVANLVTSKIGQGGQVRLRSSGGPVDLIADLSGYYVASAAGASYTGLTPHRLLDTRDTNTPLQAGTPQTLAVRGGSTGVPDTASAVALNVTATQGTSGTDIRVYPTRAGQDPPTVSNLNPAAGQTVAAAAIVAVGDDGTVSLRSSAGTIQVIVDVAGYYLPGADAGVFHPLPPVRLLDTRTSGPALDTGATRDVVVAGAGTVPFPAGVVVLNVTAVGATGPTDVRVYPTPGDGSVPLASNLNVVKGQTVANTVIATVGRDGSVRLRNANGSVQLIVDLSGWYGPAGDGWDISWPQCTAAGSTTSRHPDGGAFAIVGVTRGRPFTDNECLGDELAWADTLPGGGAVYLNVDAPGASAGDRWTQGPRASTCDGTSTDADCGWNYGTNLVEYVLPKIASSAGHREVFLDVEMGSTWQQTAGVNGNVIIAAVNRLRAAGYRPGIYSHKKDWTAIVGGLQLTKVQNWTFTHSDDTVDQCSAAASFSGGDVVLHQYQVASESPVYDHDHAC